MALHPDPSIFGLRVRLRGGVPISTPLATPQEIERHVPGITLASLAQQRRLEMGFTLDDLSEHSGFGKTHMWELCTGRMREPTVQLIVGVSTALRLPSEYVFRVAARALTTLGSVRRKVA